MIPLIFLGAGDLARAMFSCSLDTHPSQQKFRPLAFVDDDPKRVGTRVCELDVWSWSDLAQHCVQDAQFICAVGSVPARSALLDKLRAHVENPAFATVVHRSAAIMPQVKLGPGCYVAPNTTVAIASQLHEHVVVNQNVSLGHDCEIGARSVVSPGCVLSGRSFIGPDCFLGSGAVTYPGVKIGAGCVVSAHAVIARGLKDGHKAIAKPNLTILKR